MLLKHLISDQDKLEYRKNLQKKTFLNKSLLTNPKPFLLLYSNIL